MLVLVNELHLSQHDCAHSSEHIKESDIMKCLTIYLYVLIICNSLQQVSCFGGGRFETGFLCVPLTLLELTL